MQSDHHRLHIRPREVVALVQERQPEPLRQRIRKPVAEVQHRGRTPSSFAEVEQPLAKKRQIKVVERAIKPEEMEDFEQCFIVGTAAEVTPIREIDDRQVGTGKPGPVTKKVQEIYFKAIRGGDKRYLEWLDAV